MVRGKRTCRILKEIHRQINDGADMKFVTPKCRYKGDCLGMCPKCESEVLYLEPLRVRFIAGKAVALAGILVAMIFISGCNGTTSSNQSIETLQKEPIEIADTLDFVGEIDEENLLSKTRDTISNPATEVSSIKKGETGSDHDEVVTQAELNNEPKAQSDDKIKIYTAAERMPEFPGGEAEMFRFIVQHLKYPEEQLKEGIQTRVVVKFYVDTLGQVCDPQIVGNSNSPLAREALRIVRQFPNFTPGTIYGKKVNTYMTIPINIDLNF